jgi:hypothetical protein
MALGGKYYLPLPPCRTQDHSRASLEVPPAEICSCKRKIQGSLKLYLKENFANGRISLLRATIRRLEDGGIAGISDLPGGLLSSQRVEWVVKCLQLYPALLRPAPGMRGSDSCSDAQIREAGKAGLSKGFN